MRSFWFCLQYLTCQSFKWQVWVSLVNKCIRAHNLTINTYSSNLLNNCQLTWSPSFIHSSTCSQVSQLLSVLSAFFIPETSHTVKSPVVCPEQRVQQDVMWCDVQSVWVWCCPVHSLCRRSRVGTNSQFHISDKLQGKYWSTLTRGRGVGGVGGGQKVWWGNRAFTKISV